MNEGKEIKERFKSINKKISEGKKHRSRSGIEPKNLIEKLKMQVSSSIIGWANTSGKTNKEIARLLSMTEPQVSKMLSYHINHFSLEFLIEKLELASKHFKEDDRTLEILKNVA